MRTLQEVHKYINKDFNVHNSWLMISAVVYLAESIIEAAKILKNESEVKSDK